MKQTSFHLTYLLFIFLLLSCSEKNETNLEELETEVMAIHDSIMPKMTKIYYDRENLEKWIFEDTLNQNTEELKDKVSNTIRELKTAEDAMWQWMSDYDDLREQIKSQPDSIKLKFMNENKLSIIRVRDMMLLSMSKADSLNNIINPTNN